MTSMTPDHEFDALAEWPHELFPADPMRAVREQAERDDLILTDLEAEAARWDAAAAQRAAAIRPAVNAAMDAIRLAAAIRPAGGSHALTDCDCDPCLGVTKIDDYDPFATTSTRWERVRWNVWCVLAAPRGPGFGKDADAGDFVTTRWDRLKARFETGPPWLWTPAALLGGLLLAALVLILAGCGSEGASQEECRTEARRVFSAVLAETMTQDEGQRLVDKACGGLPATERAAIIEGEKDSAVLRYLTPKPSPGPTTTP